MGSLKQVDYISVPCSGTIGQAVCSVAVGIFFDLTKVYDVTDQDILLEKLNHYEIKGTVKVLFHTAISVYRNNFKLQ
jgi:hypothetical protein